MANDEIGERYLQTIQGNLEGMEGASL